MKAKLLVIALTAGIVFAPTPSQADWNPGDPYKMHYPQLPDPQGWDVDVVTDTVYDDFLCTQTGPIEDLHFWVSWQRDLLGPISWIDVSLHRDVPLGADPLLPFSHPDSVMYDGMNRLWYQRFLPGQFTQRWDGGGPQGWFSPQVPTVAPQDHNEYFQINIPRIDDPFIQQEGTVYWLGIHIGVEDLNTAIGWKTSRDHWNDDAVYWYGGQWNELFDPISGESLDMAFVITPEPTGLALLTLGALAILRKR